MAPSSILFLFSFALLVHTASAPQLHGMVKHGNNRSEENTSVPNYPCSAKENLKADVMDLPVKDLAADVEKVNTAVSDFFLEDMSQMKQPTSQSGVAHMLSHELHHQITEGVQSVHCVWLLCLKLSFLLQFHNAYEANGLAYSDSNFQPEVASNINLSNIRGLGEGVTLQCDPYNSYVVRIFNAARKFGGSHVFHVEISQPDVYHPLRPTRQFITPHGHHGTFKRPSAERWHHEPQDLIENYDFGFINWLRDSAPFGYGLSGLSRTHGLYISEASSYVLTFFSTATFYLGGFQFQYAYTVCTLTD